MTNEEYMKENHDYIAHFLKETEEETEDDMSGSVKATICQFLMNLKIQFRALADKNDFISPSDLINAQIEELRRCVVDLQAALYHHKEEPQ